MVIPANIAKDLGFDPEEMSDPLRHLGRRKSR